MTMKIYFRAPASAAVALGLAFFGSITLAPAAPLEVQAKAAPKAVINIPPVPEVPIPQSVFTVPSQPTEGRNPFFPQSTVRLVVAKVSKETPIDPLVFILNGITSPPKRTAMINGRTFEVGEEGEVRLPSGAKQLIRCEEIKGDSAVITANGQRRELRLRSGL